MRISGQRIVARLREAAYTNVLRQVNRIASSSVNGPSTEVFHLHAGHRMARSPGSFDEASEIERTHRNLC